MGLVHRRWMTCLPGSLYRKRGGSRALSAIAGGGGPSSSDLDREPNLRLQPSRGLGGRQGLGLDRRADAIAATSTSTFSSMRCSSSPPASAWPRAPSAGPRSGAELETSPVAAPTPSGAEPARSTSSALTQVWRRDPRLSLRPSTHGGRHHNPLNVRRPTHIEPRDHGLSLGPAAQIGFRARNVTRRRADPIRC